MPEDIPTWPSMFPSLTQDYSLDPPESVLRSRMDSGYIRQRQRFTVDSDLISGGWDFDDVMFRYFKAWFRGYLGMGSGWFYMPVALGGGMETQKVRFTGSGYKAKYRPAGNFWEVSAQLEVFDAAGLDTDALSLLLDPDFLLMFDGGLETAIETDYSALINTTFRTSLAL